METKTASPLFERALKSASEFGLALIFGHFASRQSAEEERDKDREG